ncbi:LL-diaminopimelate aminotransferase [Candidatus Chlamydia sanziniae]|uniref:LL-diaminopimelate aminotransferase n=1 Tax=Candidatus Chlamydia sanziniae TaxID=1806891 RepID=A0A1A9HWI1_9CHLA|nr:LL-diaminopimelate aminotransferase [Candidatus Chlamydia sanziniae]ANH78286.1 L,L-diaminopimelate aminotransferase [Candidatus Chlamydia sanziniae]
MERNPYFSALEPHYLFSSISNKLTKFRVDHPDTLLIDLSIGNTTYPIDMSITQAIGKASNRQKNQNEYQGYAPEEGLKTLRKKIAKEIYDYRISSEEIFISDGAKSDIFRIFSLFGPGKTLALQDPVYPAYVDMAYLTGTQKILALPCKKEYGFIPKLPQNETFDLLCLCYPNNPTGSVLNFTQMQALVNYANDRGIILLFDAVYNAFISDPNLPKSIFEIPEAKFCAIEINSFSKTLGFSGMRLGWTVVPKDLTYNNGNPIIEDWKRLLSTIFNGASLPIQEGAYTGLDLFPLPPAISSYLDSSRKLRTALQTSGFSVYGGNHAPYLWVELPSAISDEEALDFFLNYYHIAITPGYGFGNYGKGFVRFSAFATPDHITLACERLTQTLPADTLVSL